MSPRGSEPCFSARFSPLYGKKKGALALIGLALAASLVEMGRHSLARIANKQDSRARKIQVAKL
jgi:hypothetical protein